VEVEHIRESAVFSGFDRLTIVALSGNPGMLDAWVREEEIEVIK
jgi:hypothetical protein